MKYKTIDLLRHGEPEGGNVFRGHTDHVLTELGWQQMRDACTDHEWDLIVTSPMKRCLAFAEVLAAELDIDYVIAEEFKEFHFGVWENQEMESVFANDFERVKGLWADPMNFAAPEGESVLNFEARVLKAWFGCLARPESNILVICHGGVIRMLLKEILGFPFTHLNRMDVPFANRTRIQVSEQEPYHYQLKYHG